MPCNLNTSKMSKKSPKSTSAEDTQKGGIEKNPKAPTNPKSKESLGDDDDLDTPLYDDDLRFDNFEDDEDDDF